MPREGDERMPTISEFGGIQIRMFFDDHNPPHFHAVHGYNEMVVRISPIAVIRGYFPAKTRGVVERWAKKHQSALLENWALMQSAQLPRNIPGA
jgi:hypothetical protein